MDASGTIEIEVSRWRMALLLAGAVVMSALAGSIAFQVLPVDHLTTMQRAAAIIGVPFFGLCAVIAGWRLAALRGPVVTLSPDGFRDVRVASETIPWPAVERVSTWQANNQRAMILAITPEVERRLSLTPIARWTRGANRRLGADGLAIAATGLKVRYDDLLAATTARMRDGRL